MLGPNSGGSWFSAATGARFGRWGPGLQSVNTVAFIVRNVRLARRHTCDSSAPPAPSRLAARGESPAAFGRRCDRMAALGASRGFVGRHS